MRFLLAALFVLLLAAPASAKGQPQLLEFYRSATNPQSPVEQQTPGWYGVECPPGPGACQPDESMWVVNPTGCAWDIDDRIVWTALGSSYLGAGESVSVSDCVIADNAYHVVGFSVAGDKPGLAVTLTYEPFGFALGAAAGCVIGPIGLTDLPPVEGSNGGAGVLTTSTLTVTNTSEHRVRNIEGALELWSATTSTVNRLCPTAPIQLVAAGAVWKTSP